VDPTEAADALAQLANCTHPDCPECARIREALAE
jgi:hypothetical protein